MKAVSWANDVLDATVQNGATGTYVVGGTTYTLPDKVKFLSTVATDTTAGTEWAGGGYPAGGVSLAGLVTAAAAGKSKANTGAVSVSNAPATTWADNEIADGTGKRKVFKGAPSLAKTINAGDGATIPVGSLTANES